MALERDIVSASAVLGLGIVIASIVGSMTFYNVRSMDNTLSVTGSATQSVKADSAKWTVSVTRSGYEGDVPALQGRVARDTRIVVDFFDRGGIAAEDIHVSPVSVDQDYSSDPNTPRRYTLREQITVISKDPSQIDKLSKDIGSPLSGGGRLSGKRCKTRRRAPSQSQNRQAKVWARSNPPQAGWCR